MDYRLGILITRTGIGQPPSIRFFGLMFAEMITYWIYSSGIDRTNNDRKKIQRARAHTHTTKQRRNYE